MSTTFLNPARMDRKQRRQIAHYLRFKAPELQTNAGGPHLTPTQVKINRQRSSMLHLADLYEHCERFYR